MHTCTVLYEDIYKDNQTFLTFTASATHFWWSTTHRLRSLV